MIVGRLWGFRILRDSTKEQRRRSKRDLLVTLFFTFVPQLIGAIIFLLSSERQNYPDLLKEQLFLQGGLLDYSVALIAPVYILFLRDGALNERIWVGFYSLTVTIVSAIAIGLIFIQHKLNQPVLIVISIATLGITTALLYLVNVVAQVSPEEIGAKINKTNRDEIADLKEEIVRNRNAESRD